jgi:hypothetical protein
VLRSEYELSKHVDITKRVKKEEKITYHHPFAPLKILKIYTYASV